MSSVVTWWQNFDWNVGAALFFVVLTLFCAIVVGLSVRHERRRWRHRVGRDVLPRPDRNTERSVYRERSR